MSNPDAAIKKGSPCEHEESHILIGVGETEDNEPFRTYQCLECGEYWDVWKEWSIGTYTEEGVEE